MDSRDVSRLAGAVHITPSSQAQLLLTGLTGLGLLALLSWLFIRTEPLVDYERPPPATVLFQLDINTAPVTELSQLPGIGPTMAERIVTYRTIHGPFASIDAITAVSGIGPVTLSQIQPYIRPISPFPAEAP